MMVGGQKRDGVGGFLIRGHDRRSSPPLANNPTAASLLPLLCPVPSLGTTSAHTLPAQHLPGQTTTLSGPSPSTRALQDSRPNREGYLRRADVARPNLDEPRSERRLCSRSELYKGAAWDDPIGRAGSEAERKEGRCLFGRNRARLSGPLGLSSFGNVTTRSTDNGNPSHIYRSCDSAGVFS